jgi:hypothetical protein
MALPSRFQTAVKTPACIAGQANHWDPASLRAGAGPAREGRLPVPQHSRISWAAAPIAVHGLCIALALTLPASRPQERPLELDLV